ncbi:MAG: alpha/beta hydrolase [Pirellulaceae bacterium]|nr:alpha/beta hydrolase [Pirellulaceae bacterium]
MNLVLLPSCAFTRDKVFRFAMVKATFFVFCSIVSAIEPTHRDVIYAELGERTLRLDIYDPKQEATAANPVVIWVHGGAWRSGSKENVPVTRWLDHGFAIASVEYRLSPEARFPALVHDIKAAIRFLRSRSKDYQFDSQRFVIAGASAGGHLAGLVGASDGVDELDGTVGTETQTNTTVQAIVSFYGASNLQSILSQSTEHGLSVRIPALQLLLGGQPYECPDLARLASPLAHVDAKDPPLWLIHGDADPQMPIEQSKELATAYEKLSIPVQFDIVPGGKHGGDEFFEPVRLDGLATELLKVL